PGLVDLLAVPVASLECAGEGRGRSGIRWRAQRLERTIGRYQSGHRGGITALPALAALSRISVHPDTLGSQPLGGQSLIVIAPYVLHRHRRLWDRPDIFDPSRFLGDAKANIPRFAYLPFGAGPRTCIGASFAMQEAILVLATLIQRFELELVPDARV